MAKDVDANTMYQILNSIFGREQNENYRTNTKSNLAGTVADIGNYLNARRNYKMNEARKQKYLNKNGFDENNPTSNGVIGATGDGIYGVNAIPPQATGGGIGVDASGVYGIGSGNQSMYSGGNFDWGNTQMPNGNSVMGAWGNQGSMFGGMGGGKESDHGMNITDQTIGQNYNNRIDGQVDGLNMPRSPQGGGGNLDKLLTTSGLDILTGKDGGTFSSVLNGFGGLFGGSGSNPYQPSNSLNNSAQSIEGQNNASANDLSRYLGDEYNRGRWIHQDYVDRGIDDPVISMLRYDTKIAPLIQRARENRLKDLFMRSNNPNLSDDERTEARIQLAGELQNPDLVNDLRRKEDKFMYDQGYVRDPDGSNSASRVLSALGDYEEGEQWMSPDGTGTSRTQCSNWVSDVLRKAGIKGIGSANGDELMSQFGSAYHEGLNGIQAGDVLNFKDHVGIYAGNGQYVARNSSGGVHQGSMEEAVREFGQPLGYGSVREYTRKSGGYSRDPYRVSERERFNFLKQKSENELNFKKAIQGAKDIAKNGGSSIKLSDRAIEEVESAFDAYNGYLTQEGIDDKIKNQAKSKTAERMAKIMKGLIAADVPKEVARAEIRKLALKKITSSSAVSDVLNMAEELVGGSGKTDKADGKGDTKPNGNGMPLSAAEQKRLDQRANSDLDDVEDLDVDKSGSRIPKYYENGEEVSGSYWNALNQMGANKGKIQRKYQEDNKQREEDLRKNINERIYID